MRILLASHRYLPRHRAGVEVYTAGVARGLREAGHEVAVATTDDRAARRGAILEREHEGVRIFEIANRREVREPDDTLGDPRGDEAFRELLRRFRPEIVHFQHLMYLGLEAPRLAREAGARTLLTLHEYWLLCARGGQFVNDEGGLCERAVVERCASCLGSFRFGRSPAEARIAAACARVRAWTGFDPFPLLKRWRERRSRSASPAAAAVDCRPGELDRMLGFLEKRRRAVEGACSHVDRFLAPSRFLMQKFLDAGWPADRLLHWPNGLRPHGSAAPGNAALQRGRSARLQPGFNESTPGSRTQTLRVGFVGSLVPQKGPDVLVRAAALLPAGLVEVAIHGPETDKPTYVAELKRLAPPNVTFHGPFPSTCAPAVHAGFDLLVVPSTWYENAPLVIGESFAAGVPVVASRLGGMAELVRDGVDGRLFAPGDPADLARVLGELAEDRAGLAALARGVRPPRTIADDVAGLVRLYEELAGAAR